MYRHFQTVLMPSLVNQKKMFHSLIQGYLFEIFNQDYEKDSCLNFYLDQLKGLHKRFNTDIRVVKYYPEGF